VDFVSESDVRAEVSRREKIHVGPRTIVTPSARDLGNEHEIFVLVNLPPAASGKSRLE
jgi:ethanolamine utilization cobalamin adenosyltransferase